MRAVVETTIPGNTQPNPACKVLLQAIAEALEEVGPAPFRMSLLRRTEGFEEARAALRLLQDEISKTTCRGVALVSGEKPDVSEGNGRDQFQVGK
jgi:hypothetical protein